MSLAAEDGERRNFHRSARALPAVCGHAGHITCHYDTAGHSLNSRLCRVPEARGNAFEELWRYVLNLYGWKPRKFRIPGEENDFTAIYQGLHILGEVRWFDPPMDGNKMRAFLAKLDPRPQTIGLFISYSGFDQGALGVRRRSANSKTVVTFIKEDIEEIMLESADPGPIFDEKLRDAYDFIFERTDEG